MNEREHGAERNRRMHSEKGTFEGVSAQGPFSVAYPAYEESRVEKWCAHCKTWVAAHGVRGMLKFMAHHESKECTVPVVLQPVTARKFRS